MGVRGPLPKPKAERQNQIKRPEIGLLEAPRPAHDGAGGKVLPLVPRAPAGLGTAARRRWIAFWHSPVAKAVDLNADRHRLERWVWLTEEWDTVSAVMRKQRITRGSMGQPVLNPLAAYLNQLSHEINQAEQQMGLTPAARLRLGIAYGEAKLTALELNRQLDEQARREHERAPAVGGGDSEDAEWEEA